MQLKKLWLVLIMMFSLASLLYIYIWFYNQNTINQAYLATKINSCLHSSYSPKGLLSTKEKEKIYLSITQNSQYLTPLDGNKIMSLGNQELGIIININDAKIDLSSSKPLLNMEYEDQEKISEIFATFVGSTIGDNPNISQQVLESLKLTESLQVKTQDGSLQLNFSC